MARLERVARDHAEGERDAYAKMVTFAIEALDADAKESTRGSFDALTAAQWANAVDNSSSETVGLLETSGQLAWAALTSITAAETTSHLISGTPVRVGAGIPPELFRDDRVIESLWAATVALDAATAIRIGRFDLDLVGPRARPDEVATFRTLGGVVDRVARGRQQADRGAGSNRPRASGRRI